MVRLDVSITDHSCVQKARILTCATFEYNEGRSDLGVSESSASKMCAIRTQYFSRLLVREITYKASYHHGSVDLSLPPHNSISLGTK